MTFVDENSVWRMDRIRDGEFWVHKGSIDGWAV